MGRRFSPRGGAVSSWSKRELLTAESGSFTVPDGVFRLRVYTIGRGADGQPGSTRGGDGGAGGGCAWGEIAVTPGQIIPYSITSLATQFGDYLKASAGIGRDAPGVGTVLSTAVEYSGFAQGGYGGQGAASTNSTSPSHGGGGAASGSPLGDGGDGANGMQSGGGGGGWGRCLGSTYGHGAGVGGNAGYYSPSSSAAPGSSVSGTTYLPGRDQFSAFTDPLLAPCVGGLYTHATYRYGEPAPGVGGWQTMPGGYGAGSGADAVITYRGLGGFGGGGGGGRGAQTPAGCVDGSPGGYGGGGGGGGGTYSTGTPATTQGGPGGPGCIAIFYSPQEAA